VDDTEAVPFGGSVLGGQQPIIGAHVYLFKAGVASGTVATAYHTQKNYSQAPTDLLGSGGTCMGGSGNAAETADSDGNCYVTTYAPFGDYAIAANGYNTTGCSTKDSNNIYPQVYMLAVGGNTGAGLNANVIQVVAYGDCPNLATATTIDFNELTSAITATALQQFANLSTGFTNTPEGFSSSSTNTAGLHRAMLTVANLIDVTNPVTPRTTTASNTAGYIPVALIEDLGNVLAYCVNSRTTDSSCATLSNDIAGSTVGAKDTLWDAIKIAQNPATTINGTANTSTLWSLISSSGYPFPTETTAPNDWSIAISYNSMLTTSTTAGNPSPNTYGVEGLAIDASGNVWFPPYHVSASTSPELMELDPVGNLSSAINTATALNNTSYQERFIAIDATGNIWTDGTKTEIWTSAGARQINSSSFTNNFGIAFDTANNAWIAETAANTIGEGTYTAGTSFADETYVYTDTSGAGIGGTGRYLAIDSNGYGWLANYTTETSSKYTAAVFQTAANLSSGSGKATITAVSGSPFAVETTGISSDELAWSVALDANNYAFVGLNGVYAEFTPAPTPVLQSGVSGFGTGTANSQGQVEVQVDGAGNVWLANYGTGYSSGTTGSFLQKFAGPKATTPGTSLSGTQGIKSDQYAIDKPYTLEIDSSGNIWIGNTGGGYWPGSSIGEFIGLAAPVVTPKALALKNGTVALLP
jgi:hypothetical protein